MTGDISSISNCHWYVDEKGTPAIIAYSDGVYIFVNSTWQTLAKPGKATSYSIVVLMLIWELYGVFSIHHPALNMSWRLIFSRAD